MILLFLSIFVLRISNHFLLFPPLPMKVPSCLTLHLPNSFLDIFQSWFLSKKVNIVLAYGSYFFKAELATLNSPQLISLSLLRS